VSNIGKRLKAIIRYSKVTQEEFADKIGSTRGYISLIANDHQPLTMGVLEKLIEYHPMLNLNWLFFGEGPMMRTQEVKENPDLVEKVLPLNHAANVVQPLQELLAQHEARIALLEDELAALKELLNQ